MWRRAEQDLEELNAQMRMSKNRSACPRKLLPRELHGFVLHPKRKEAENRQVEKQVKEDRKTERGSVLGWEWAGLDTKAMRMRYLRLLVTVRRSQATLVGGRISEAIQIDENNGKGLLQGGKAG